MHLFVTVYRSVKILVHPLLKGILKGRKAEKEEANLR